MSAEAYSITAPLTEDVISEVLTGQRILLTGIVYTARDAAHKRLVSEVEKGNPLPIPADLSPIFYVGPSPARPGLPIGSAGPTTSSRMDAYSPLLMKHGYRVMIGKGARSQPVREAIVLYRSVYMAALGGAGAVIAKCIESADIVAYPELGPEAIYRLAVRNLPLVVVNDIHGNDVYVDAITRYGKERCTHAV